MQQVGMDSIESVDDIITFYNLQKEINPTIMGLCDFGPELFNGAISSEKNMCFFNTFAFGDGNNESDDTVYSFYESEEFKQICEITRQLNEAGVIPSDYLSNPAQVTSVMNTGGGLMRNGSSGKIFEFTKMLRATVPEATFENFYIGDKSAKPCMSRGTFTTGMGISSAVQGDELIAYVKTIDLLQSSQEWYDLIMYGIEGTDYTITDTGAIEIISTQELFPSWFPNNVNFIRYPDYIEQEQIDTFLNWDEGAIARVDNSFVFDNTEVIVEYSELQAVEQEYLKPILYGYVDYESNIEEALEKLKKAGIDKYIAELQEQYSASQQ